MLVLEIVVSVEDVLVAEASAGKSNFMYRGRGIVKESDRGGVVVGE